MPTLKTREPATKLSPVQAASIPPKNSRLRRIGQFAGRHSTLTQVVIFMAIASGTSLVLLYLLFKGAWSDHKDNFAILNTIFKMETSRESSLMIGDNDQRVVTRTFSTLEPHLETDGWTWINRFGSTITYGKQDQRLIASCSPYSPLYIVCDFSEIQ